MSEIERIICKGIINETYLDEENKCDFLVTKQRKTIRHFSVTRAY